MGVFSKLQTVPYSCRDYAHPWTNSCTDAAAGIGSHSVQECLRIYVTVYTLALLMRGRVPTKKQLRQTILGIIQSTAFLSCHAYSFMLTVCSLRRITGNFNYLTVSFVPAFISSFFSIMIERPSRRSLLCLYVTNVASETIFRMAARRGLVKPIPHGEVYIFMAALSSLLYFYRSQTRSGNDSVYSLISFIVGPYEQKDYREVLANPSQTGSASSRRPWLLLSLTQTVNESLRPFVEFLKAQGRHPACPHPHSCLHYTLHGAAKQFAVGYGLQACLNLLLRFKKIARNPSILGRMLFGKDAYGLAAFLGGFSGIFRLVLCLLRRSTGNDSPKLAVPAGLLAGTTFAFYPSPTVALYMMWKTLQVAYNAASAKGYLPELPWATILLYCFSTAVLFHAAVLEPRSLRPSYWRFLLGISGGRFFDINRECLTKYGTSNTSV
ncbi:transmembrane protein 135-like isoform X1 [Neocloeon triangulifer]|uniref:transmembrane protein 135-like isoform X1 n=1 Tax=Neocloeon triangulifer TaxID=2078957 RepID=UPI00286FA96E|nr:transmembrane protein 135-like isoform X1 [Neocloeon triangulifer]XP_059472633.1 transmembrane protein 135-like isoform X1 [Neocloeon triangulifer]